MSRVGCSGSDESGVFGILNLWSTFWSVGGFFFFVFWFWLFAFFSKKNFFFISPSYLHSESRATAERFRPQISSSYEAFKLIRLAVQILAHLRKIQSKLVWLAVQILSQLRKIQSKIIWLAAQTLAQLDQIQGNSFVFTISKIKVAADLLVPFFSI